MATLLSQLAPDLKNAIIKVKKLTSVGIHSVPINVTEDSLFLLSEVEIFGFTAHTNAGEGSQYEYYQSGNSRVKTVKGSASSWWERSPSANSGGAFCNVGNNGDAEPGYGAHNFYGVAFGFCI